MLIKRRFFMNYFPLTNAQRAWKERTAEISERDIGPRAVEYDRQAEFPQASLNALRDAGLWSLRMPQKYGGLGLDLVTTCLIVAERAVRTLRSRPLDADG
jgi:alkylation response protein AidB-like acyl-CoA dehydrogenase